MRRHPTYRYLFALAISGGLTFAQTPALTQAQLNARAKAQNVPDIPFDSVPNFLKMPEHIHLLLSEPEVGTPSTVMQVLKQRTARALLPKMKPRDPRQIKLFGEMPARAPLWQTRFHDFNVWTEKKRVEKLRRVGHFNVGSITRVVLEH